jgi:hypothetical protein
VYFYFTVRTYVVELKIILSWILDTDGSRTLSTALQFPIKSIPALNKYEYCNDYLQDPSSTFQLLAGPSTKYRRTSPYDTVVQVDRRSNIVLEVPVLL